MQRVRELEAWSAPGYLLPPEYGKSLQVEVWDAGIPRDVFLELNFIPDETDSINLRQAISAGEYKHDEFRSFCELNGLIADLSIAESAAKFIEYSAGRPLAWIHLPESGNPLLLPKIVALMKTKGHLVVDDEKNIIV